jgi:transmembrane sensor
MSEPLQQEALHWIVRLTSGEATALDADELRRWRAASATHEAAFQNAARLWNKTEAAVIGLEARAAARPAPRRLVSRRALIGGGALAASAAAVTIGAAQLNLLPSYAGLAADYKTAAGERTRIALPDGSVAELNTRSAIALRFTETERRVDLLAGEAVFEVAHAPERPFIVSAAGGMTRAVGTVFSVRADDRQTSVICLEGQIDVTKVQTARLGAGQGVTYGPRGLATPAVADAAQALSWRSGVLSFRDEPLAQVVDELNRYRSGRILVAGEAAQQKRVSGIVHLDRQDEILRHIESSLGLRVTPIFGGIVLIR